MGLFLLGALALLNHVNVVTLCLRTFGDLLLEIRWIIGYYIRFLVTLWWLLLVEILWMMGKLDEYLVANTVSYN